MGGCKEIISRLGLTGKPGKEGKPGPQGPAGPQGVPGAAAVVPAYIQRIKGDLFNTSSTPGVNAVLNVSFNELTNSNKIITFDVSASSEDTTGTIGGVIINISGVVTPVNLFNLTSGGPQFGTAPAKIKYDRDPNLSPTGYSNTETINYVYGKFRMTRELNLVVIDATVYGYNFENQERFGRAVQIQKTWHINDFAEMSPDFTINVTSINDGNGASVTMKNILRYNL